jgi:hypothetical protein
VITRCRRILLIGEQTPKLVAVPQCESDLHLEDGIRIRVARALRDLSGERMIAEQLRTIITVAETVEVADAEKSNQEKCDYDRKQSCGT